MYEPHVARAIRAPSHVVVWSALLRAVAWLALAIGGITSALAQVPSCTLTAAQNGRTASTSEAAVFVELAGLNSNPVQLSMTCSTAGLAIEWFQYDLASPTAPTLPGPVSSCREALLISGWRTSGSGSVITVPAPAPGGVSYHAGVGFDSQGVCVVGRFAILVAGDAAAGISIVSGNNQVAAPGQTLPQNLVVAVRDANGTPVINAQLGTSFETGPGLVATGTIGPPTPTATAGEYAIPVQLGSEPGTRRIRVCLAGTANCVTFQVATDAAITVVSGSGQVGTPGQRLPQDIVVKVVGAGGAPLPGVAVSWALVEGSGSLSPSSSVTDAQGQASTSLTLGAEPGTRVVRASTPTASIDIAITTGTAAIERIVEQTAAAQAQVAISAAQTQISNIRNRLDFLRMARGRSTATTASLAGLRLIVDGQSMPLGTAIASLADYGIKLAAGTGAPAGAAASGDAAFKPIGGGASSDGFERWGLFVQGDVELGRQRSVEDAGGFKLRSHGVTLGGDYRFEGDHVLGASLGLLRSDTTLSEEAGSQDVKGYSISVYGALMLGKSGYVNLIANAGRNDFEGRRRLATAGFASSDTSGDQLGASLSAGYDFAFGSLTVSPFGRVEYIRADIDGFEENDAGSEALQVGSQRVSATFIAAGGHAWWAIPVAWGVLQPNARIEWQRQTAGSARVVTTRQIGGLDAEVAIAAQDKEYGTAALGAQLLLVRGAQVYFNYERQFARDSFRGERFMLGARLRF